MTSVPAIFCVVEGGGRVLVAVAVDDGGLSICDCDCDSCSLLALVNRDRWGLEVVKPTLNRANWGTNVAMVEWELVRPAMEDRRGCIARRMLPGAIS